MQTLDPFRLGLVLATLSGPVVSSRAQVTLGAAPPPPTEVSGLPGGGPRPKDVTGSFSVDTSAREQVREFYNAVYTSSDGTPINSTAVTASCLPGTNSPAFADATLRRINWFRALAGVPAAVTFDAGESAKDQAAALMMAEHGALQHTGSWTGWDCFSSDGTNAAANSNLVLGNNGPDAIWIYIKDWGSDNAIVGHRRWLLYPQTQVMATGDVPPENSYFSANATWVFDANIFGPRPATRAPYVAWPPAGFAPYQVVAPQWSFALSNADFSTATVTVTSNGAPVALTQQPFQAGIGENTLVWYPSILDPTTQVAFPFGGTDTVYTVTVSHVLTAGVANDFRYNVTVFDPGTTGADYSPLLISGTNQPAVNAANAYRCTPATNPHTTGYQWLTAQSTNGNLVDNSLNGLINFTITPAPIYPIVTNPPVGTGSCFHLAHTNEVPQLLQLKELLFPSNTTTLSFKSLLGYATGNEIARVQASVDGGLTWRDIYVQAGVSGSTETAFKQHTLLLSAYAGTPTRLRFDYDILPGTYYPQITPNVGWCLENIIVTNTQQLLNLATNSTASTNFLFTPTQLGDYVLQARGVIFNEFPLDGGTAKPVTAIVGPPLISLKPLILSGSQVKVGFTLTSGVAASFHLLQASQLGGAWMTNGGAVLSTNVPGSSFQFTTTNAPGSRFYRVQTP